MIQATSLNIVKYPHPTLRCQSRPIKRVDRELVQVVREMFGLMYESKGIGLAANQVDLPLRFFIANLSGQPGEGEELVFINPAVSNPKGQERGEEGCLSFPELYGPVTRPQQVDMHAFNLQGEEVRATLTGLLARVVQHELDHLDGVLFIDRMDPDDRALVESRLQEFERDFHQQRESGGIPGDESIAARRDEWQQRYC